MRLNYKFYITFFKSFEAYRLWIFLTAFVGIAESIVTILSLTLYAPVWSFDFFEWYVNMRTPKSEDEI